LNRWRWLLAASAGAWIATTGIVRSQSASDRYRDTLSTYCAGCHSERQKTPATQSGVILDNVDLQTIGAHPEMWERVVRKLRARAMPPAGARRPDEATYRALTEWIEAQLDEAAAARPRPGRPALHRLNRAEYANAVRDLLALDVDVASLLPADDSAYGFDNIADVLGVSPSLQERYLSAADVISSLAIGDVQAPAVEETYRVPQDLSQNEHIEGLPLGTMGGLRIDRTFPVDGTYDIRVRFFRTNFGNLRGLEHAHDVEMALDGTRLRMVSIGGDKDLRAAFERPTETADEIDARLAIRLPLTAGPHTLTIAFVENLPLADTARLQPFLRSSYDTLDWTGRPHLDRVTITGPFDVKNPGTTPSRARIFTCHPLADLSRRTSRVETTSEGGCARQILATLTRRAYRQPAVDADLPAILQFFEKSRGQQGSFDAGIQAALQLILASPKFVFRPELDPPGAAQGSVYRISDVELASRLSFFLWSSIPDDELLTAAGAGRLHDAAVLERQVRRMLADPKADALVANFAGQWLQLRNLKTLLPNSDEFPDFDDNLRQALQRETELFFATFIREDRNVLELMTAKDTFVNERLARHYGIEGIYGSRFRRVTLADPARWGLLGKGAILAVTSHATRTSPVVRGKWILENVLGTPVPPPPPLPGAGVFVEPAPGEAPRTMRAQMELHRTNPACASCHKLMDPIGLSLENFDAVGRWRTREVNGPIDASGQLSDGTTIDGVVTLRQALLRDPDVFVTTLTEKLLTYALGRGLNAYDMPAVRRIVRAASRKDDRFSALVLGIVGSVPFERRAAADDLITRK
jgi:hypothetical protein